MKIGFFAKGFTLLELLVTLAVVAILITVAVPSFNHTIKKNHVQAHQRDLLAQLNFARSEAVARGQDIGVCGSADSSTCNGSNNWSVGWIIFVDNGAGAGGTAADGLQNGSEEILKVYDYAGSNELLIIDSAGSGINNFGFTSRGYLSIVANTLTLRICEEDDVVTYARALLIEQTGRVVNSYDLNNDSIYEDVNGNNLTCS